MANLQCPVESIGNAKIGDTVEMRVESIEDGMANLAYVEMDDQNLNPKPSAIKQMSEAFTETEEE